MNEPGYLLRMRELLGENWHGLWVVTYTTDNTAAPPPTKVTPSYSDGFTDGWNARDVAG